MNAEPRLPSLQTSAQPAYLPTSSRARPALSVIVPAYNCASVLERCLQSLDASDLPRSRWELIVADDGSTDDTPDVATSLADRVVRVPDGPGGPGRARNLAARQARGEVLVFVDSDVCVSRTALRQFVELFATRPDLGAAFGAYDREPEAHGLVSQYRNLLHHYVHSRSAGPATTFWAGCGAVRRDSFVAVGGFDADRYRRPQIEDIELGYRLAGRGVPILLCPDVQGKHLKRWTLRGGIVTDFRDRGVPWMRLLLERGALTARGPLNLEAREKVLTALAGGAVLAGLLALVMGSWMLALVALTATCGVLLGNAALLGWFARERGWRFTFAVMPLRLTYYLVNGCSAAWALLTHGRGRSRPSAHPER